MQSLEKNWLLAPKMRWAICWILMWAVASLKICTLMCYFCRNYIMLEPKKYRGVMYHNTEEWCKIWRGTELCFDKWPNTRKSQNLHFNELLLIRVYNVWDEKLQRTYTARYLTNPNNFSKYRLESLCIGWFWLNIGKHFFIDKTDINQYFYIIANIG